MANRLLIDGMDLSTLMTDGMNGSAYVDEQDSAFKTVAQKLPQKQYGYTRLRLAVTVPANSQQSVSLRNMGNIGLISNPTIDSDDVTIYSVSGNVIADSIPVPDIGGNFWRKPRLNNNYQTGNLPTLGILTKILDFPADVNPMRPYVVMDSEGNIYYTYYDGADERVASRDRSNDLRWNVVASVYDGRTLNSGYPRLDSNETQLFLMGSNNAREPFVYSTVDGSDLNTHLVLKGIGGEDYFITPSYMYVDYWNNNDWLRQVRLTAQNDTTYSNNTINVLTGTMSWFSGYGYCSAWDGSKRNLYKGSFNGSVTKMIDNWWLFAQDEYGVLYGVNQATGEYEAVDVSGNVLWTLARSTISSGVFFNDSELHAVDESNGIFYVGYGRSGIEFAVCAIDRTNGSILWNRNIHSNANIGTVDTFENNMSICVDRHGMIVGYNYYTASAAPWQAKMNLFLYDSNTDTEIWEKYESGYNYTMEMDGLQSQVRCHQGGGPCGGWKRFVWSNPSSHASNVGGLYILE